MSGSAPPLVAVVTPVFNGAPYLAEAMRSVQAQTWPNLVHVILDNASDDATPHIIDRHRTGRVPLISARNARTLPLAENWNAAMGLVPPEAAFVRLLCADDRMDAEAVEKQVRLALTDPKIGAVGALMRYGEETPDLRWPNGKTVYEGREAIAAYFLNGAWIPGIHTLWRRAVLDLRTPFFDPGVLFLDAEVCLLAWSHGWRFGLVREALGFYRVHAGMESMAAVHRDQRHLLDYGAFLERYGRDALEPAMFETLQSTFRRYHLRRLALWRSSPRKRRVAALHARALAACGRPPRLGETAQAWADWALKKARLRPAGPQHPRELAPPRSGGAA